MIFNNKQFIKQYTEKIKELEGVPLQECSDGAKYAALVLLIKDKVYLGKVNTLGNKQVYYFSMEFLPGKFLKYYLVNLGIYSVVENGLSELGIDINDILQQEVDPGLGNGGLGRLASCFLDSMTNLKINGHGNGMRYKYGLFRQSFEDGYQVESPDNWLCNNYPWETMRPDKSVVVKFKGNITSSNNKYVLENYEPVLAVPYDIPMISSDGTHINNMRVWSAKPADEHIDMNSFNAGDYGSAISYKANIEAISYVLYPEDNTPAGKKLRLKQEYFIVSSGIQSIIRSHKKNNYDILDLPKYVCIHINDTHPAISVAELMRILIDEENLSWDVAFNITSSVISYTNHTILPEALEKWDEKLMMYLLPRVYMIICEIDRRHKEKYPEDTSIIQDGYIHMANLAIIGSYSVNGVAALHSNILKDVTLNKFYKIYPKKFNNKTNGINYRRFLLSANPDLTECISNFIGDDFKYDLSHIENILKYPNIKYCILDAKQNSKIQLCKYIKDTTGIEVDAGSIFDIQVKRIHAYKRQLLNVLKIISLYQGIKAGKLTDIPNLTFIFAGKSAPGYVYAKNIIKLINSVASVINADSSINGKLKLVFLENFNVSLGEIIYPAADISEQISTASMEASGTGNMKFMLSGAITLGTMDGANIEIYENVGKDNIFIFGKNSDEILDYKKNNSYMPAVTDSLKPILNSLIDGTFSDNLAEFRPIYDELIGKDEFFVLEDFECYLNAFYKMVDVYKDKDTWSEMMLINIAKSGVFSSDRTIKEYIKDIWKI